MILIEERTDVYEAIVMKCNCCGCIIEGGRCKKEDAEKLGANFLYKEAKEHGWTVNENLDKHYCPTCIQTILASWRPE